MVTLTAAMLGGCGSGNKSSNVASTEASESAVTEASSATEEVSTTTEDVTTDVSDQALCG